eukprot:gb/GECG01011705.1/.p1 GENE.gb/GECG01011705.1/~~gb/GECG01011705.1/.p1  ORF type:complete len:391 (+),score=51.21 gb/GECG01011705.1/:1-1173(+)
MTEIGKPVELSPTGQPKFEADEEIQHCAHRHVDLYDGDTKLMLNGTATISTHKVYWLSQEAIDSVIKGGRSPSEINFTTPGYSWHLSSIVNVSDSERLFRTPKIGIQLQSGRVIQFGFKGKGKQEFKDWLNTARQRRSWETHGASTGSQRRTKTLGVAGLIQQRQQDHAEEQKFSEQAFSDLDALVKNARKAVDLAKRYAEETGKKTEEPTEEKQQFANLTENLGLTNIVTKETSGSRYYNQLARQLADFTKRFLERSGGMMTLTDVYCLYNRARGTHLVSPKDLWKACSIMDQQNLGIRLKTLESGTAVLQIQSHDEATIVRRIVSMLSDYTQWVSAAELATQWHVPLPIAKHHLLLAEQQGYLCRDDSMAGIRFYKNLFLDVEQHGPS